MTNKKNQLKHNKKERLSNERKKSKKIPSPKRGDDFD